MQNRNSQIIGARRGRIARFVAYGRAHRVQLAVISVLIISLIVFAVISVVNNQTNQENAPDTNTPTAEQSSDNLFMTDVDDISDQADRDYKANQPVEDSNAN